MPGPCAYASVPCRKKAAQRQACLRLALHRLDGHGPAYLRLDACEPALHRRDGCRPACPRRALQGVRRRVYHLKALRLRDAHRRVYHLQALRLRDARRRACLLQALRLRDAHKRACLLQALRLRDVRRRVYHLRALRLRDARRRACHLQALRLRDAHRRVYHLQALRLRDARRRACHRQAWPGVRKRACRRLGGHEQVYHRGLPGPFSGKRVFVYRSFLILLPYRSWGKGVAPQIISGIHLFSAGSLKAQYAYRCLFSGHNKPHFSVGCKHLPGDAG